MKSSRSSLGVGLNLALFVAITAIVWFLLGRMQGDVGRMAVTAPRSATVGQSLPLHISLSWLKEPTRLCADLHWSSNRDSSNLFLTSGGSKPIGREGGSFDFEITVTPVPGLRYVHGIIFLSPTGKWEDQTLAVATDLIPVTTNRDDRAFALAPLSVNQPDEPLLQSSARLSPVLRKVTACLLLVASVLAGRNFRSASGMARRWWLVLALGLTLAAAWELLGLEGRVGDLARSWLRAEDAYYSRRWFQKLTVSAVIAAAIVLLRVVWFKPWPHRWSLIFFGLYLALAVVNLLSLHALDRYADVSWHGILPIDGVKFISVATLLASVIRARKPGQAPPPATTE